MDQTSTIEMGGKISTASYKDATKTINGPLEAENQIETRRYVEKTPCNRGSVVNSENTLQNITNGIKELHIDTSKGSIPKERRVVFGQLQNTNRNLANKRKQSELYENMENTISENMGLQMKTSNGKVRITQYSKNNSVINSKPINVQRPAEIHKPKKNDESKKEMIPKAINDISFTNNEVLETSAEIRLNIPTTVDASDKPSREPSLCLQYARKDFPNEAELKKRVDANIIPKLFSPLPLTNTKNAHYIFLGSEYELDIYNHLFALERKISIRANHLDKQLEVTSCMRSTLMDWINEASSAFCLTIETFLFSVGIVDRFMQLENNVKRDEYQLVGVTAMCLASKYEEVLAPAIADWIYMSDHAYTAKQIIAMERRIFSKIGYNLSHPLAIKFLRRLSKVANINKLLYRTSKYLLELSTISYELASVEPSRIAAASLFLALHLFSANANSKTGFSNELWTTELGWNSRHTAEALHTTCKHIAKQALNVPGSIHQAIYKKYQTSKLDYITANPLLYGKLMKSIAAIQES